MQQLFSWNQGDFYFFMSVMLRGYSKTETVEREDEGRPAIGLHSGALLPRAHLSLGWFLKEQVSSYPNHLGVFFSLFPIDRILFFYVLTAHTMHLFLSREWASD